MCTTKQLKCSIKCVMNNVLLKGTNYFEHIIRNIAKINIPTFHARTVVFIVKMCLIKYCYAKLCGITVFLRNLKYHPSIKFVAIGTQNFIIIVIIIFLHGLGRLNCSGIDALPSFPGASAIPSSPGFVDEGVFREFGVVHSFEVVDPVLFVFDSYILYSRDLLFFSCNFTSQKLKM